MRFYIGVTDNDWFEYLRTYEPYEINFWRPKGTSQFKRLEPGGVFLFKLHSPYNYIVGGGFFVRHEILPLSLAWSAFGNGNGMRDIDTFRKKIRSIRRDMEHDPEIGCTLLMSPFFWESNEWIPVPEDWSRSIVKGKSYSTDTLIGRGLWNEAQARISDSDMPPEVKEQADESQARYGKDFITRARLGQGMFRIYISHRCVSPPLCSDRRKNSSGS